MTDTTAARFEDTVHRSVVSPGTVVLASLALVTSVLGVLGFPMLPVPTRGGSAWNGEWNEFTSALHGWATHDGWRWSGSSWFWGASTLACVLGILVLVRGRGWTVGIRMIVIMVPTVVVLAGGPLLQRAVGASWADYEHGYDGTTKCVILAIAVLVAAAVPQFRWRQRRSGDVDAP